MDVIRNLGKFFAHWIWTLSLVLIFSKNRPSQSSLIIAISTMWLSHSLQWGSAARDYSLQCDRPSHLPRVIEGGLSHVCTAIQRSDQNGTVDQLWNQSLTWCTESDCLGNLIPPTKGKTRKWGPQVTGQKRCSFPTRLSCGEPLESTGCEETWDG